MLSPNARAFSVDNLIGNTEKKTEIYSSVNFSQQGYRCLQKTKAIQSDHDHCVKTVFDDSGTRKIKVELGHGDLWDSFCRLGTEMIITKSGRRTFPAVRVHLMNLLEDRKYRVYVDFLSLDHHKYRYVYHSSRWMVSGTADRVLSGQSYVHPDCPVGGRYLMNHVISFEKLKLTNNNYPKPGQISLVSMQKYLPRIHVELLTSDLKTEAHFVTSYDQTAFMAVTAYQNQEITRLKIARNPFAKGFRESGKSRSTEDAMMSAFHSYMASRNSPAGKRCFSNDEPDLPRKMFRSTLTRIEHGNVNQSASPKHSILCDCHLCLPVSTYHQCRLTCCCNMSRDASREIIPCQVCPSSFLPYWSYPCVRTAVQSQMTCHQHYRTVNGYIQGISDVKPCLSEDVKQEPVSETVS